MSAVFSVRIQHDSVARVQQRQGVWCWKQATHSNRMEKIGYALEHIFGEHDDAVVDQVKAHLIEQRKNLL